ncbi:hypothetical protein FLI59_34070 [Pseudomonas aeruginosa]|nr:hypothetical protein FLI59_34070 [Pseudomonas aeruginosa]
MPCTVPLRQPSCSLLSSRMDRGFLTGVTVYLFPTFLRGVGNRTFSLSAMCRGYRHVVHYKGHARGLWEWHLP